MTDYYQLQEDVLKVVTYSDTKCTPHRPFV